MSARGRLHLSFLLDTNVISEMRKVRANRADANVADWARSVEGSSLFLSAISVQEIEIGILKAERRAVPNWTLLREWLDDYVLPEFSGRILPVDTAVAKCCAALQVPTTRPYRDGFIAATALVHGMVVVTRNVADFAPMGVKILDPWAAAPT